MRTTIKDDNEEGEEKHAGRRQRAAIRWKLHGTPSRVSAGCANPGLASRGARQQLATPSF